MVETDNIIIVITSIGYNLTAKLLVYNIAHKNGDLIDGMGDVITGIEPISNILPTDFSLKQNYPNPFNPATTIEFSIPQTDQITLSVFNILGQAILVETHRVSPGAYQYQFNGANYPSGLYFYRLTAESGFAKTRKMILKK